MSSAVLSVTRSTESRNYHANLAYTVVRFSHDTSTYGTSTTRTPFLVEKLKLLVDPCLVFVYHGLTQELGVLLTEISADVCGSGSALQALYLLLDLT